MVISVSLFHRGPIFIDVSIAQSLSALKTNFEKAPILFDVSCCHQVQAGSAKRAELKFIPGQSESSIEFLIQILLES